MSVPKEQWEQLVEEHNESDTVSRDGFPKQQHVAMVQQIPSIEFPVWDPRITLSAPSRAALAQLWDPVAGHEPSPLL